MTPRRAAGAVQGETVSESRDKRRYRRLPVTMTVELVLPGGATQLLRSRDISEVGLFLEYPVISASGKQGGQSGAQNPPQVGTEVYLKVVQALTEDASARIKARVVRICDEGIALRFENGPPR